MIIATRTTYSDTRNLLQSGRRAMDFIKCTDLHCTHQVPGRPHCHPVFEEIKLKPLGPKSLTAQEIKSRISQVIEGLEWLPMRDAPQNAEEVIVLTKKGGSHRPVICHWAQDLSGEEQPAYRGWFYWTGYQFAEVSGEMVGWLPLEFMLPIPYYK